MKACPCCGGGTNRTILTRVDMSSGAVVSRSPLCANCHVIFINAYRRDPHWFESTVKRSRAWEASVIFEKEKKV